MIIADTFEHPLLGCSTRIRAWMTLEPGQAMVCVAEVLIPEAAQSPPVWIHHIPRQLDLPQAAQLCRTLSQLFAAAARHESRSKPLLEPEQNLSTPSAQPE